MTDRSSEQASQKWENNQLQNLELEDIIDITSISSTEKDKYKRYLSGENQIKAGIYRGGVFWDILKW
jgi:hypothetical protein